MKEITFLVEPDLDSGFIAQAQEAAIFTQADDLATLKQEVKDAVHCHYPDRQNRPDQIRLKSIKQVETLNAIFRDIAQHLGVSKEDLIHDVL